MGAVLRADVVRLAAGRRRCVVAPGASIAASSRSVDTLDVFLTDAAGAVQTSTWVPSFGADWLPWHPITGGTATPGAPVSVVSRAPDHLDVFVTDPAGAVRTAACEPSFGDRWSDWRQIAGGVVTAGATIGAVTRSADHLDVFVADMAGAIQTSAWEPSFDADWSAWRQVAGGAAPPGALIAAVSRAADHIDLFVIGSDGRVATAAWEPAFGATWHGWSPIC